MAQASRLCCEQNILSLTGETPVPLFSRFDGNRGNQIKQEIG